MSMVPSLGNPAVSNAEEGLKAGRIVGLCGLFGRHFGKLFASCFFTLLEIGGTHVLSFHHYCHLLTITNSGCVALLGK
jgi:hypothetical protein